MAKLDLQVLAHLEWLGFVQPTGLVVSAPALVRVGAILNRHDAEGQGRLRECVEEHAEGEPAIADFEAFARMVLGWTFSPKGYAGMDGTPIPPELEVALPDYGETLRPDLAVREMNPADGATPWQLLVRVVDTGQDLDHVEHRGVGGLEASAHGRMERLLRETGVPAGLLCNGQTLRLVSAPRGESSGWLDFPVAAMTQTAGRPICAALRLLLGQSRLLTLPAGERLAALLRDSRRFQNEVSERLAEQVLHALYELLRGFQAAHDASGGELLRAPLAEHPDEVYHALLTLILRLLFVLYAEEREMLPASETFVRFYSVAALYERLRADAGRHPDTMDARYGAWAQLLVLFRMVHDGARDLQMPARHGVLFDPDRYPFLEGRSGVRQKGERVEPPRVPDGTVFRALEDLLVLDGERISYRALDVEQIGSVYETMMGFRLERATGRSVAIKSHRAATAVDLDALAAVEPGKRAKWVSDHADRKLTANQTKAVKAAGTLAELHAALDPTIDHAATPDLVPAGAMVLQPSEERRRSGSHYTPRELTEPIVRTTLDPVLARFRGNAEAILELKVCDPAMGSGAFLVEACRQLADALVEAWAAHGGRPDIPADEDEVVFARRLVAQRCLYGVDRNPVAVDLAKMSLWLVTLAREHALTFLDHALRHGDSLVGLSRRQIESFHWDGSALGLETIRIGEHLARVAELRAAIRTAGEDVSDWTIRDRWDEAQAELRQVRLFGDLVIAAFFTGDKPAERQARRDLFADAVQLGTAESWRGSVEELREAARPVVPFHWQIEFPEVFDRERPGFDAIVGNPPFAGGRNLSAAQGKVYLDWLVSVHKDASGGADLVAHFFRRAFHLLRRDGTFGLIATNTIAQGDTRASGLRWICTHSGEVFAARKRVKWPGMAAVVVSVVHVSRGPFADAKRLDDREVDKITAFLVHRGGNEDPVRLAANTGQSFQGSIVLGMGFTFDDTDTKGVATPLAEMRRLIDADPANAELIYPYIGGEEVNTSPTQAPHRYVINFGERGEEECRRRWPALMAIVEEKVKPDRITKDANKYPRMVYEWWKYWNARRELQAAVAGLDRVLAACIHTQHLGFAFLPSAAVFQHGLIVFPLSGRAVFCALQSRPHEAWARFFGSSLGDGLRYTPSDCFQTFPFPADWHTDPTLEAAGQAYDDFRAQLMVENDEGLTKTYNRFHDPNEQDPRIERLRALHADMDRAVLDAYGWHDVPTGCEFLLDYEVGGGRLKQEEALPLPLARRRARRGPRAARGAQRRSRGRRAARGRRGRRRQAPADQGEAGGGAVLMAPATRSRGRVETTRGAGGGPAAIDSAYRSPVRADRPGLTRSSRRGRTVGLRRPE
jgi:hypothetical protein